MHLPTPRRIPPELDREYKRRSLRKLTPESIKSRLSFRRPPIRNHPLWNSKYRTSLASDDNAISFIGKIL